MAVQFRHIGRSDERLRFPEVGRLLRPAAVMTSPGFAWNLAGVAGASRSAPLGAQTASSPADLGLVWGVARTVLGVGRRRLLCAVGGGLVKPRVRLGVASISFKDGLGIVELLKPGFARPEFVFESDDVLLFVFKFPSKLVGLGGLGFELGFELCDLGLQFLGWKLVRTLIVRLFLSRTFSFSSCFSCMESM